MNKIITLLSLLGLSLFSINSQAQCDDSTCGGYPPPVTQSLTHTHTTPKGFFLSPDPIIKFNHRTFTCPNGYIGTDGTPGLITEEQKVTYYPNGQISYGEWHDLEDNCQEKPKTPPPPQIISKTILYGMLSAYNEPIYQSNFKTRAECMFVPTSEGKGYIRPVGDDVLSFVNNPCPHLGWRAFWFDKDFKNITGDIKSYGTTKGPRGLDFEIISYEDFQRVTYWGQRRIESGS